MGSAPLEIVAAVAGRVVAIESVPDPAFSEKMVGDGVAIEPADGAVSAPCAGRVVQVHKAGHAYGIEAPTGARVLVHVGLDTVELRGKGFRPRVAEGQAVRAGDPLVEVDRKLLAKKGINPLTIVVVENVDEHPVGWRAAPGASVRAGQDVILRVGGTPAAQEVAPEPPAAGAGGPASPAPGSGTAPAEPSVASGRAAVRHPEGLHARPAALVAAAARRFRASVEVLARGRSANARSALALMGLAAVQGEEVEVVATGPDAAGALAAVIAAIASAGPAAAAPAAAPVRVEPAAIPLAAAGDLGPCDVAGVVASAGQAVGVTFHLRLTVADVREDGRGEALERCELERALREVAADLDAAVEAARRRQAREEADILEAHRAMIEDPAPFARALALLADGKGAAHAWTTALREQAAVLAASGSALLAERVADLRDLTRQVVAKLSGAAPVAPELPPQAILLAEDLSPGELASLDRERLVGIVTHRGGPTSHVAIVARSQGIPALVAAGPGLRLVPDGETAVLDGDRGVLRWRPSPEALAAAQEGIARRAARHREAQRAASGPAQTLDGVRIEVAANVSRPEEAAQAAAEGADGVGLLRTELLFLGRDAAPTEEEQRAAYQAVVDALGGRPVIIRTLDVGADKQLPWLPMPPEENPALGLRGVRLSLARPELLAEQLRACLRVRPLTQVRIMLPMVTDLEDVARAREVLRLVAAELGVAPPPLGVMVETPAAALLAGELAAEVDFLSVGTNDLTQYALAMDRGNAALAPRVDGLHPAVLRLLAATAEGAARHGRWVGVCGGLAADPLAVPLLLGMGAVELSVGPAAVAGVKAQVRRLSREACAGLFRRAQALGSAAAVRELVRGELGVEE